MLGLPAWQSPVREEQESSFQRGLNVASVCSLQERDSQSIPHSLFPKTAGALAVVMDCGFQGFRPKVWIHFFGKIELGVGRVPHEKAVGKMRISPGANDEVDRRQFRGHKMMLDDFAGDGSRIQALGG